MDVTRSISVQGWRGDGVLVRGLFPGSFSGGGHFCLISNLWSKLVETKGELNIFLCLQDFFLNLSCFFCICVID